MILWPAAFKAITLTAVTPAPKEHTINTYILSICKTKFFFFFGWEVVVRPQPACLRGYSLCLTLH